MYVELTFGIFFSFSSKLSDPSDLPKNAFRIFSMLVEFLCTEHIDYALETGLAGEYNIFWTLHLVDLFVQTNFTDRCLALLIGFVQNILAKWNSVCVFGSQLLISSEVLLLLGEFMHGWKCATVFKKICIRNLDINTTSVNCFCISAF